MDINRANMDELFKGFQTLFARGLANNTIPWEKFSTVTKSSTAVEVYPFLEQFGGMKDWTGDRQIQNLTGRKMEVRNRDFEDTVSIDQNDIEDDHYGLYATLLEQLGYNAAQLWGELAEEALISGAVSAWIDGKSFFNAAHKYGSGKDASVIGNKGTEALTAESYGAARVAMMSYKGHSGKSLKVRPNLLICGPSNEAAAYDIVKNSKKLTATIVNPPDGQPQIVSGSVDNGYAGTADVVVLNNLDSQWFLADVSAPLRPVVVQQRKQPVLTRMDQTTDDNVFRSHQFLYGTAARGSAFLTYPHLIFGSFPE